MRPTDQAKHPEPSALNPILFRIDEIELQLEQFVGEIRAAGLVTNMKQYVFSARHHYFEESLGSPIRRVGSDFGVSVTLPNNAVVDYWFDCWFDGEDWFIEAAIHRHDPDEDGSHVVACLLDSKVRSATEAGNALHQAAVAALRVREPLDPAFPRDS